MKLFVNNVEYKIRFYHDYNGSKCYITTGDDHIVGYGASRLSQKDQLNRPLGRKIVLARAIRSAFPTDIYGLNREARRQFWKAYMSERKRLTGKEFNF